MSRSDSVVTAQERPSFTGELGRLARQDSSSYKQARAWVDRLKSSPNVASAGLEPFAQIPNGRIAKLAEGRHVLAQEQRPGEVVLLFIGTRDRVEEYASTHVGWIVSDNRLRELKLPAPDENVPEPEAVPHQERQPGGGGVFDSFANEDFERLNIDTAVWERLRALDTAHSLEALDVLADLRSVNPTAADLLNAYAHGNADTQINVLDIARGDAEFCQVLKQGLTSLAGANPDELLDPTQHQRELLERGNFDAWLLYLHPDQKRWVEHEFHGPARLRGISGSGKTVVALHRARRLALRSPEEHVLFTTHNRALAREAGRLLGKLCGAERRQIVAMHLDRWCLRFLADARLPRPFVNPQTEALVRASTTQWLRAQHAKLVAQLPLQYIWDEIAYMLGRLLPGNEDEYLVMQREGRRRGLTQDQRQAILGVYREYRMRLRKQRVSHPLEFARSAHDALSRGVRPKDGFTAIVADEVQDFSEIHFRILASLVDTAKPDTLFLTGDGTQRIYTPGFSLRSVGIDVSGRSHILRKNYRNTEQILRAAFPLVSPEWADEYKTAGVVPDDLSPEYSSREGPKPKIVKCSSIEREVEFVADRVKNLLVRYEPRGICVMARNQEYRRLVLRQLGRVEVAAHDYQADSKENRSESVRVSSLHSAKGHEYGVVFIVGFVDGVIPYPGAIEAGLEVREKALLYVAITRARDLVYLTYATADGRREMRPSSYLAALENSCDLVELEGPSSVRPMLAPSLPSVFIGDYKVLEELDPGGMAEVFRVAHVESGAHFFLKRVSLKGQDFEALRRELHTYDRIMTSKPSFVMPIADHFIAEPYLCLVTEFATGGDLHSYIQANAVDEPGLDDDLATPIARQIVAGLEELHALDIVHRDLKPSNILLCDTSWRVADFGISKVLSDMRSEQTFRGAFTYAYAAPEQLQGAAPTPAMDVYSFGRVLTYMLSEQQDPAQLSGGELAKLAADCAVTAPEARPTLTSVAERLRRLPPGSG